MLYDDLLWRHMCWAAVPATVVAAVFEPASGIGVAAVFEPASGIGVEVASGSGVGAITGTESGASVNGAAAGLPKLLRASTT